MSKQSATRVVMAKQVARAWLERKAKPEHRLTIYASGAYTRNLSGLLRAMRDGKTIIANVKPIPDLGVESGFDSVSVWSADYDALVSLRDWAEGRDMETSGIW